MTKIVMLAAAALVLAAGSAARADDAPVPSWPRVFEAGGQRVLLHQPQVESWEHHLKLRFRSVVAVARPGTAETLGVIEMMVKTVPDFEARDVMLYGFEIEDLRFPDLPEGDAAPFETIVRSTLPLDRVTTMSLDEVLAYVEKEDSPGEQKPVKVSLKPPKVLYSRTPAVLVMFMGKPRFRPVPGTKLLAAENTNWDVFRDEEDGLHYLLHEETWLSAPDPLKGPWTAAAALPADMARLPADPNWESVRKALPLKPAKSVPVVFATTGPAELIVTEGEPTYEPIPSTKLQTVKNTESVLFRHLGEETFYFLVAGRWFRAKALEGPWTAASADLPADFAAIPEDSDADFVKVSVPGTDEAKDAVLLASVPRRTAVKKSEAKFTATYDGAPKFVAIEGTAVKYAANSPDFVFLVDGSYYACHQAVWFVGKAPEGPWTVSTMVPAAIYAIPPSHPAHVVTYVQVYDSTEDTVNVGYTSGYTGEYVTETGVLVFGSGEYDYDDDDDDYPYYYYHYYPYYYSYGCGAVYWRRYGCYRRVMHHGYGPYGGAGRWGYYNRATGSWARGPYRYGAVGNAYSQAGYNPFTDPRNSRMGATTPYGTSGRFYGERDADWSRHPDASARARAGWSQAPRGGLVSWEDGRATPARDVQGNLFAGRDGNVYKRSDTGEWQQKRRDGWERFEAGGQSAGARETPTPPRERATPPPQRVQPRRNPPDRPTVQRDLQRSSTSRVRGQRNTQRVYSRPAGGGRVGGGGRGGGGRGR